MPEDSVLIFILPPSLEELKNRLLARGTESIEAIEKRLSKALDEIRFIGEYEYYIVNDDLEKAVGEALSIVDAERLRVPPKVKPIIRQYEEE